VTDPGPGEPAGPGPEQTPPGPWGAPPPPPPPPPPPAAPAGGWPPGPAGLGHDPTAGYGSTGPWSEQQPYGVPGYAPYGRGVATEPLGVSIFFLMCCPYGSPVAVILAISAQRRIDASGGYLTGRGMATAALVLGIIGCAALVLNIVLIASGEGFTWYQS
jgi:hypothetical protein